MENMSILIYGIGTGSENFISLLKDKSIIKAFIDSNIENQGKKFHSIYVFSPEQIKCFKYDYIIIATQFYLEIKNKLLLLGISAEKIIEFYRIIPLKIEENLKLKKNLNSFIDKDYELMVTGISYALRGIDKKCFNYKTLNSAMSSQDLFYDFKIVEYLLKKKTNNRLKKAIIGIAYYSFDYDLSKASIKDRVMIYRNLINDYHHYNDIDFLKAYENFTKMEYTVLVENYIDIMIDFNKNYLNLLSSTLDCKLSEDKYLVGKEWAVLHSKKNYTETFKENVEILKNYILMLNGKNIDVNLVVFPTSKYYYEHFSIEMINKFYKEILKIKRNCKFNFYDFFSSKLFTDNDFADVSHLNERGAKKISEILNILL